MTSLIRWNATPTRELLGFRDDVDRLFDSLLSAPAHGNGRQWLSTFVPALDVEETKDAFIVHMDLPGVSQNDVKVSLLGDVLTIRGERKQSEERKDRNVHRVERRYGTFERSITLGVSVRGDQVKANVRDGVLEIQIPKAEEARVREIDVQVAS